MQKKGNEACRARLDGTYKAEASQANNSCASRFGNFGFAHGVSRNSSLCEAHSGRDFDKLFAVGDGKFGIASIVSNPNGLLEVPVYDRLAQESNHHAIPRLEGECGCASPSLTTVPATS